VAMSLEFCLAAQANTLAEVKTKLESQISEYIEDINEEKDDFQKRYLYKPERAVAMVSPLYAARLLNNSALECVKDNRGYFVSGYRWYNKTCLI